MVFSALIATAQAREQLLSYHFQAFEYSPTATQQPDFALAFARTTPALAAKVPGLSLSLANSYASAHQPGTTITKQGTIKLPAGRAAFFEGVQVIPGEPNQQFEVYVLGKGALLWSLNFRADVAAPGAAAAFVGIAQRFAFT